MKEVFNEARMNGYKQGLELGESVQSFIRFHSLRRYLDIFDLTSLAGEKARLDKLFELVSEEAKKVIYEKNISDPAKIRHKQAYEAKLQFLNHTRDTVNVMLEAMRKEQYLPVFRHKKET